MGALGLITLSPLAAALNPSGLAPIAGLPRAPRADLNELERLKAWVDARARPDAKICGLGSSYTFSGQLIGELWQLRPERGPSSKLGVTMPDVDTVDGPPGAALKDCAIVIVGDPVQTHLDPDYQQTVIMPSREMLAGQGIGAKFRRTGEVFHLEKGVSAVVFERMAPLDDSDIAALQARWRGARGAGVRGARRKGHAGSRAAFAGARGRDRVLGDHPLFVGRDDEDDGRRTLGADDLRVPAVRFGVEMDAHPFHVLSAASRTRQEFSPMPAVKTTASAPLTVAASAAELAPDAGDEIGDGVARRGLSEASSSRMSWEIPDMPLRPEFLYRRSEISSAPIFFSAIR